MKKVLLVILLTSVFISSSILSFYGGLLLYSRIHEYTNSLTQNTIFDVLNFDPLASVITLYVIFLIVAGYGTVLELLNKNNPKE